MSEQCFVEQLANTMPNISAISIFFLTFTSIEKVISLKCYACAWTATHCQDFNCYNNPDVCSNNNFSPQTTRPVECSDGCETFVVTDPNGKVCN